MNVSVAQFVVEDNMIAAACMHAFCIANFELMLAICNPIGRRSERPRRF